MNGRSLIAVALVVFAVVTSAVAGGGLKVSHGTVAVDGGKLYYEAAGKGRPVVLIHGGQMDGRMWDEQFTLLAQSYRVIRYDVRGYGRSTVPTKPYSNVDDLDRLLTHLGVSRAVLVGLSLGGGISVDYALVHPERVEALVLSGPGLSGYSWSPESVAGSWKIITAARDEGFARATELWLQDPMMSAAMENGRIAARVRELVSANEHVWLMNPFLERELKPPAAGRLAEIRAPTLVLVGSRDVADIQRIGDLVAEQVPGARKETVEGAAHIVNMEKPEEFNRLLLDFLAGSGSR